MQVPWHHSTRTDPGGTATPHCSTQTLRKAAGVFAHTVEAMLPLMRRIKRASLHTVLSTAASGTNDSRIPLLDHLVAKWRVATPCGVHSAQETLCNVRSQRLPVGTCVTVTRNGILIRDAVLDMQACCSAVQCSQILTHTGWMSDLLCVQGPR